MFILEIILEVLFYFFLHYWGATIRYLFHLVIGKKKTFSELLNGSDKNDSQDTFNIFVSILFYTVIGIILYYYHTFK